MKRKSAALVTCLCFLILTGFTETTTSVDELRAEIKTQRTQIRILLDTVESLRLDREKITIASKEDKIVLSTVAMLTRGAVPSRWADPAHIKTVITACKKGGNNEDT